MTARKTHEIFSAIAPYLITVLLSVVSGLVGLTLYFLNEKNGQMKELTSAVTSVQTQLAVIEGNRFTAEDGKDVWKEIAGIKSELVRVNATIPKEVPPKWFQDEVADVSQHVSQNSEKLDVIIDKVNGNSLAVGRLETQIRALVP